MKRARGTIVATLTVLFCATQAHAHFKLLKPTSWLNEDALGGPQKGSPCGPGNVRPFIGDDVQPIPTSGATTSFHAGETITVQWQETVYHPGYFRISLAPVAPADATASDLPNPALSDPDNCHYDKAALQTGAHDNVLADGLFMADEQSAPTRSLMQDVKLPNEPCDHCTLQVVQVMDGHPAQSCYYFHCAEIQVLPAADGGMPAAAGAGEKAAAAKDSGCSVVYAGARRSEAFAVCGVGILAVLYRRRRQRRVVRRLAD